MAIGLLIEKKSLPLRAFCAHAYIAWVRVRTLFINILTSDCIAKTISIMEQKNFAANENFDWNAFENDLNLYGGQSKEAITEAYGNTMSNVAVGEVCLLYTSDAADDMQWVDLGGGRLM